MAQAAPMTERGPSSFASKNPFRNLIPDKKSNPSSTNNPFLDSNEIVPTTNGNGVASTSGLGPTTGPADTSANALAALNLNDEKKAPQVSVNAVGRRENMAPPPYRRGPPPNHRPSNSEEERRRQQGRSRGPSNELDIFADPPGPNRPRDKRLPARRNSESSVREKSKELDPEAEKRRRERKLREAKEGKDTKSSSKSKKPSKRLDIIDQLDVTSIYGTGLFHHDGPFDACRPHRNRQGAKQAPMQAFPKGSLNMALGGSGPNNSKLNLDQIHGREREANFDYNGAAQPDGQPAYSRRPLPDRSASFNPTSLIDPVHGDESAGLGTSTFLEGAPASRAAIQRRESEQDAEPMNTGLSRKKSLAQRIKSVRPRGNDSGRMASPEPFPAATSPMGTGRSEQNGANPFFKEYDQEYEKKGQQIAFAEEQARTAGRARAPSSPKRGALTLERSLTAGSTGPPAEESKPSGVGGLLSRVKSIKGGRKTRERRNTEASS